MVFSMNVVDDIMTQQESLGTSGCHALRTLPWLQQLLATALSKLQQRNTEAHGAGYLESKYFDSKAASGTALGFLFLICK